MDGEKTKLINEQIKQTRARTLVCGERQLFGSSSSRATFLVAILRCCMQPLSLSLFSICLYLALRLDVIYIVLFPLLSLFLSLIFK